MLTSSGHPGQPLLAGVGSGGRGRLGGFDPHAEQPRGAGYPSEVPSARRPWLATSCVTGQHPLVATFCPPLSRPGGWRLGLRAVLIEREAAERRLHPTRWGICGFGLHWGLDPGSRSLERGTATSAARPRRLRRPACRLGPAPASPPGRPRPLKGRLTPPPPDLPLQSCDSILDQTGSDSTRIGLSPAPSTSPAPLQLEPCPEPTRSRPDPLPLSSAPPLAPPLQQSAPRLTLPLNSGKKPLTDQDRVSSASHDWPPTL